MARAGAPTCQRLIGADNLRACAHLRAQAGTGLRGRSARSSSLGPEDTNVRAGPKVVSCRETAPVRTALVRRDLVRLQLLLCRRARRQLRGLRGQGTRCSCSGQRRGRRSRRNSRNNWLYPRWCRDERRRGSNGSWRWHARDAHMAANTGGGSAPRGCVGMRRNPHAPNGAAGAIWLRSISDCRMRNRIVTLLLQLRACNVRGHLA